MNKIDKLDKELEKAREKAAEWQTKIRELEKQKQEEEDVYKRQLPTPLTFSPLTVPATADLSRSWCKMCIRDRTSNMQ